MTVKFSLKALTIYPKLVLSFCLMIVPIYVTSLYMNNSGQEVVKTQISESMSSRVHFYLSSLETEQSRLTKLKAEYLNDDDLITLGTAPEMLNDFEKARMILAVKSKLYLLRSTSSFVENVKLFIPALGRSIMANNYDDEIPEGELKAILDPANMKTPIFNLDGKLLISGVYPDAIYVNRKPVLALEIELSKDEIVRTLSSIVNGEQGGAALIGFSQQWSVSSGIEERDLKEIKFNELIRQPSGNYINQSNQTSMEMNGRTFLVAYEYSSVLDTTLVVSVPAELVLQPLNKHRDWLWIFSLIAIVLVVMFSYWIYRLIHKPLKRLVISFRKVEKGDLSIRVYHNNQDEFQYLYNQFNAMLGRIQVLIHEVYEEQIRSQRSELKQLQSQINPHFFYNSFFILQGLVSMREHELADKMFHHLGGYFQFITRSGSESVPLEIEINHAISYVEIQKIRFSGTVDVEFEEVPDHWKRAVIPRLIVQPLIENAYLHGLENKAEGGILHIHFTDGGVEECLYIEVEDNGDSLSDEQLEHMRTTLIGSEHALETTGILNTHRRLQLKFGTGYGLSVSRSELGGLKAQLKIGREEAERNA
jgi:two-component system sensor histidine kinase YesM